MGATGTGIAAIERDSVTGGMPVGIGVVRRRGSGRVEGDAPSEVIGGIPSPVFEAQVDGLLSVTGSEGVGLGGRASGPVGRSKCVAIGHADRRPGISGTGDV